MSVLSLVLFAIVPGTLISLQEGVFVAHQRTEFVTFTTAIAAVINIAISLFLLMQGYGVESLVVAFVVVQWTVMSFYFFFIQRYISALRWRFEFDFARKLLGEIKTFAGISFVAALFSRPEIIILSLFSSEAQIGFYSAALKVISVLEYIPQIYMTNVFPILSRAYHTTQEKVQDIQNQSIKYLLAISLPLAVGLFVAAEPIIHLLYGTGFEPSAMALRILAFDLPFAALYAVLWRVLVARQEQGIVLRAMIIVTLTELVAGYVLISRWASLGAAVNTPFISIFYVCLLALSLRSSGIQLFFLKFGWRFAIAALGMGILISAIGRGLELWVLVPVGVVTYSVLVVLFRAFSPEDIAMFRTFRQPRIAAKSQIDE